MAEKSTRKPNPKKSEKGTKPTRLITSDQDARRYNREELYRKLDFILDNSSLASAIVAVILSTYRITLDETSQPDIKRGKPRRK
jgi:hypothetical protein